MRSRGGIRGKIGWWLICHMHWACHFIDGLLFILLDRITLRYDKWGVRFNKPIKLGYKRYTVGQETYYRRR